MLAVMKIGEVCICQRASSLIHKTVCMLQHVDSRSFDAPVILQTASSVFVVSKQPRTQPAIVLYERPRPLMEN